MEALDLTVVAELRHRKRKDWLVQYQKDFLAKGLGWRLVEAQTRDSFQAKVLMCASGDFS